MSNNISDGPVVVHDNEVTSINVALTELAERIDRLRGLRGRSEIFDRVRIEPPEEVKDAVSVETLTDSDTVIFDKGTLHRIRARTSIQLLGAAPGDAQYIVAATHAELDAERLGTDTGTTTWDFGTAGQAKVHAVTDSSVQKVEVVKNSGTVVSTRKQLNFIEGANVTLTIADDVGNNQADITIAAAGAAGTFQPLSEKNADAGYAGYETGTFTMTATGFSASITGTARYVIVGALVCLFWPTLTGTSNATTLTFTGLPAEIQPTETTYFPLRAADNTVDIVGWGRLNDGSSTIDLFATVALGAWTNSGTKTAYASEIAYHRF